MDYQDRLFQLQKLKNDNGSNLDRPKAKILLVDDEPDILEFLQYNLEKAGYATITAKNGEIALKKAEAEVPDLILLDIMMPGMDGVQTCQELRKKKDLDQTLITFLTARGEEYSEIAGLEAGADDYIQKPIRSRLLISRINALLRRKRTSKIKMEGCLIELDDLVIDQENMVVFLGNKEVELTKKEYDILLLLAQNPGKVFSRREIFRKVWDYLGNINSRTIDVHICKLRDKLGEKYIKTMKGVGYKLDV